MKFSVGVFLALFAVEAQAFVLSTSKNHATALQSAFMPGGTPGADTMTGTRPSPRQTPESSPAGGMSKRPSRGGTKKNQIVVQGGSLKTWTFLNPAVESVQVYLATEGRPLDADVELWQGPDNTPYKMRVYLEDGSTRAFNGIIQTPRGPNTVAIRNIGQMEFPMLAAVNADNNMPQMGQPRVIQGGALRTYPFDPMIDSVAIRLTTDGRPLNARIELLQGPNNNKQVIELYTEDGMDRPFFAIIRTPGSGNVVRVVNTATVEFPLACVVEPYETADIAAYSEPVMGGDNGFMGEVSQW